MAFRLEQAKLDHDRVDALTHHPADPIPLKVESPHDLVRLRAAWRRRDSVPCHIVSREFGVDHSWPGVDVRTFVTGDNSSGRISAHDVIIAPGAGLPAHCQEDIDIFLFVVDGEIELTVGRLCEPSRKRSFAYIPACTTTAWLNKSNAPARLYLLCHPAGMDRAFADVHELWLKSRARAPEPYLAILSRYGFCFDPKEPLENDARTNHPAVRLDAKIESFEDFAELRNQWSLRPAIPKLMHQTEGLNSVSPPGGATGSLMVSGDESSGVGVFGWGRLEPGYEAEPHYQPSEEEIFYVIEGELQLTCGSQTLIVKPGGFGFAPRGATHGFRNPTNKQTFMVTLNSPAGHERGFEMIMENERNPTDKFPQLVSAHGWQFPGRNQSGT